MICPEELVALATAIGVALAKGRNLTDLNIMAGVLGHISTTIATIAIQRARIEDCRNRCCGDDSGSSASEEELLEDEEEADTLL